ncbi:MAG TPA: hypothetical protein VG055_27245 [Planctomycetaceae bacterium]|nr:hypothetical protein [Planctomycetaceae bacterium]
MEKSAYAVATALVHLLRALWQLGNAVAILVVCVVVGVRVICWWSPDSLRFFTEQVWSMRS